MSTSKERVQTLHPNGMNGVRIAKDKYDSMRRALLKVVPRRRAGVAFQDLAALVEPQLDPIVYAGSSVTWYLVAVKQDLEARELIEQVAGAKPQRLRRTSTVRR